MKMDIAEKIKRKGLELGFTHVGITSTDPFPEYAADLIINREKTYSLYDPDLKAPYRSYLLKASMPRMLYPDAQSIICATWGFGQVDYPEELLPHVARAYQSRAYVPLPDSAEGIREAEFRRYIESLGIHVFERTDEIPDREACARAGIVTFGRNNFAFTPEDGSFNILVTLIVDKKLPYDEPTMYCDCPEDCTKCIDACPNHAMNAKGELQPRICMMHMQYTPIGELPEKYWKLLGSHLHGCDECQIVCPRNAAVLERARRRDPFLEKLKDEFDLEKVLLMDDEYYDRVVHPIMYNYIRDKNIFRRNAAIILGNTGTRKNIPALQKALQSPCEGVREAAQWAIGQIQQRES
jgi:epoxyqueuosine reductase